MPVYDEKYVKGNVKELNCVVNTNLWGDEAPNEGVHYTCIVCVSIDFAMKIEKIIIHQLV